jgi:hypothetical protein
MRWLALDTVGGGWLVDYDVFNLGFTPGHATALCRAAENWADTRQTLFHVSRAGIKQVVRCVIRSFPEHWGFVADVGDDDALRLKSIGLLRFSTYGVQKRYGNGVTKAEAIVRYCAA